MTVENRTVPPVYFNHLYIVLDDKSYRAIQASDFLRIAFPGVEQRGTHTAAGETWVGTYYYCQDNYLELFGASAGRHWQPGAQVGWAGLAFSTDQAGGVAAVREAIQNTFHYEPFNELRQVQAGPRSVNWFYHVNLAERLGLGSFDSWVMEYHPDIFAAKGIALPQTGQPTRQAYLSPWNKAREGQRAAAAAAAAAAATAAEAEAGDKEKTAKQEQAADKTKTAGAQKSPQGEPKEQDNPNNHPIEIPRTPVFSRLIGATIHMDARRAARFAEVLTILGYAQEGEGEKVDLSAHGFTLQIRPEESAPPGYRLSSLRLAMARPSVAPMTFVFAPGSRLELREDLTAEWRFGV